MLLFWNSYKYMSRSRYIFNRYREIYMTQQEVEKDTVDVKEQNAN